MNVLLIRHSHAEDRSVWNDLSHPDSFRPLTKKGKKKFHKAAMNLCKMIQDLDCIYTSQYTRAIETAEILKTFYEKTPLDVISTLNPDEDYRKLSSLLEDYSFDQTVAFIGHQPKLGEWASELLNGQQDSLIRFKKGGVACISYLKGKGQLQWLLTCNQLASFNWST